MQRHLGFRWPIFFLLVLLVILVCCIVLGIYIIPFTSLPFVAPTYQPPLIKSSFPLKELWCKSPEFIVTQITLANDIVYIRTSEAIKALDEKNGNEIWSYPIQDDSSRVPPALHDNSILVISKERSSILLINATTGQKIWELSEQWAGSSIADSVAIGDLYAYITWRNSGFVAYDLVTGTKVWAINFQGARSFGLAVADVNDNVYISKDGAITAYNNVGNELWTFSGGTAIKGIVYEGGYIYFYQDGVIRALNSKNGLAKWDVPFIGGRFPLKVTSGVIYATGHSGEVLVLDFISGAELWRTNLPTDATLQSPAIFEDQIYVTSLAKGAIFILNKGDGQQVGNIEISSQIAENNLSYGVGPQSDNNVLIVPSGNILCAFGRELSEP